MPARISLDEWPLDALDPVRRRRLSMAPDGERIVEMLLTEMDLGPPLHLRPEDAEEKRGYWRVNVAIPCSRCLFDYLFNGPTGYRAHYYASACVGAAYNRRITQALAYKVISMQREIGFAERISLTGPWSKIWPVDDEAIFAAAPENQLRARRWAEYHRSVAATPLRAPLPEAPQMSLIGTWVNPFTGEVWLSPHKIDRAMELHLKGIP